ncbi:nucleoside hydrolase [Spongiimicrobium salis]|uniref:nucleoside hydrolase n=1 Tax=Spongiimicrobium salis TaxID=1667022 RepID=UPI00374CA978
MRSKKLMKALICSILTMLLTGNLFGQKNIIFDTDFGGDADDLGALAMLNHFQNKKEIELMGVMCWNAEKYAVSAIDAVNTYYGNPDIPIGFRQSEIGIVDWNHSKVLADNLPHDVSRKNATEATELYRKLLAGSPDQQITIVTVGPLMNIKKLINSKADKYSPLSGRELIKAKVKEFVIMGGQFPKGERKEWNFDGNMPGVTQYVLEKLEVPITFLGYEIGVSLKTGEVFNNLDKNSPLYLGFYHFSKYAPWMNHQFKGKIFDNATYDQTAVLYAVRGGVDTYWSRVSNGICVPDSEGRNSWKRVASSQQSYLVLKWPKAKMEAELEKFMLGNF